MAFETTVLNQATDVVLFTGARPLLGLGASALITLFVTRDPNEWKRLLLPNLILIGWGATIFTKTAADVAIMTVITVVALLISLMATLRVNNIAGSIRTVQGFASKTQDMITTVKEGPKAVKRQKIAESIIDTRKAKQLANTVLPPARKPSIKHNSEGTLLSRIGETTSNYKPESTNMNTKDAGILSRLRKSAR